MSEEEPDHEETSLVNHVVVAKQQVNLPKPAVERASFNGPVMNGKSSSSGNLSSSVLTDPRCSLGNNYPIGVHSTNVPQTMVRCYIL